MSKIIPDYKIAHAAGQDAGNRSMKRNGRTAWNEDDYNAARETFIKLCDFAPEVEVEILRAIQTARKNYREHLANTESKIIPHNET